MNKNESKWIYGENGKLSVENENNENNENGLDNIKQSGGEGDNIYR